MLREFQEEIAKLKAQLAAKQVSGDSPAGAPRSVEVRTHPHELCGITCYDTP